MEPLGDDAWVKEDSGPRRRFIAYYRVSTRAQGRSGLGLEAQQAAVGRFLQSTSGDLFAEFTEVESGTKAARPQFNEALRLCRIFSAILVIAKLDRLARNVALIAQLMESGVEFVAADFPQANRPHDPYSRGHRGIRGQTNIGARQSRSDVIWKCGNSPKCLPDIWMRLDAWATWGGSDAPRPPQ